MMGDRGVHTLDSGGLGTEAHRAHERRRHLLRLDQEVHPLAAVVTFQFPARGNLPPVKLTWYEGMQPPRPVELEDGASLPAEGGAIFHGTKGTLMTGVNGPTCPGSSRRPEARR